MTMMLQSGILFVCFFSLQVLHLQRTDAFFVQNSNDSGRQTSHVHVTEIGHCKRLLVLPAHPQRISAANGWEMDRSRRQSLFLVSAMLLCGSSSLSPHKAVAATAPSTDANKAKFGEARKSLQYLVDNFDEVSKGGGDNVRRYLGTVVTDAPMVGIMKVLRDLQKEADDIVEYTETLNDFEYSLRAADTAVYSANFVTFSSARTKPEEYFENAKRESKNMLMYMDAMADQLNYK